MHTVLIVDHEPESRRAIAGTLEEDGDYTVLTASTAQEAQRVLQQLRPDVTILDMEESGDGGMDLACKIKTNHRLQSTRVIVISALSPADLPHARELSVRCAPQKLIDVYFAKPYSPGCVAHQVGREVAKLPPTDG